VRYEVTYVDDVEEYLLAEVGHVLDRFFNGIVFIVVRQTFVST